jgi:hypothetical protein
MISMITAQTTQFAKWESHSIYRGIEIRKRSKYSGSVGGKFSGAGMVWESLKSLKAYIDKFPAGHSFDPMGKDKIQD